MTYDLIIKKQAKKKLQSLSNALKIRITEKIIWLGKNPDDKNLDIKKLVGSHYYRLRVGDWPIIYERKDQIKVISIEALKPRGDAYK
ncbi:MAG: type II toxin-antitoxin system RelE family toxin [Gammaproteobacteria bacterium]